MSHTILLVQFAQHKNSRVYLDYETVFQAYDGVCQLYEQGLKVKCPDRKDITYDILDLFQYIDTLADLGFLVYDNKSHAYTPHDKEWIKKQVFLHLKKQITQASPGQKQTQKGQRALRDE